MNSSIWYECHYSILRISLSIPSKSENVRFKASFKGCTFLSVHIEIIEKTWKGIFFRTIEHVEVEGWYLKADTMTKIPKNYLLHWP